MGEYRHITVDSRPFLCSQCVHALLSSATLGDQVCGTLLCLDHKQANDDNLSGGCNAAPGLLA
jgi:hypothetical protein